LSSAAMRSAEIQAEASVLTVVLVSPTMRHAILGAGGIGGLLGAALSRAGADVVLLMRPEALARYGGRLVIESAVLGDFEVGVPAEPGLDREVDLLWVTTKAMQLEPSLTLAPTERIGGAIVIPLLNGVDHIAVLRARYRNVVAGAIRVESERLAPARIRQSSPFLRVELAGAEPVAAELRAAGIDCRVRDDELSLLWDKLAFLAPVALVHDCDDVAGCDQCQLATAEPRQEVAVQLRAVEIERAIAPLARCDLRLEIGEPPVRRLGKGESW